jgi:hypothetical protein
LKARQNSLKFEVESQILSDLKDSQQIQQKKFDDYFKFKEQVYTYMD